MSMIARRSRSQNLRPGFIIAGNLPQFSKRAPRPPYLRVERWSEPPTKELVVDGFTTELLNRRMAVVGGRRV